MTSRRALPAGCPECYAQQYPECTEHIIIAGDFNLNESYLITVKDQFGNVYRTSVSTNNNNELEVPVADFPQGLFTRFGGAFEFLFWSASGCTPYEPILCGSNYPCLLLSFFKAGDSEAVDIRPVVGCCQEPQVVGQLSLDNITSQCNSGTEHFDIYFTVSNGSGQYRVDIFYNGNWQQFANFGSISNGSTSGAVEYAGNNFDPGTYPFRIVDFNNQSVVSSEGSYTINTCPYMELQSASYDCLGANGNVPTYSFSLVASNTGGSYQLQLWDGGGWQTIYNFYDYTNGLISRSFILPGIALGSYPVRVIGTEITTNNLAVTVYTCAEPEVLTITNVLYECISGSGGFSVLYILEHMSGTGFWLEVFENGVWVQILLVPTPGNDGLQNFAFVYTFVTGGEKQFRLHNEYLGVTSNVFTIADVPLCV